MITIQKVKVIFKFFPPISRTFTDRRTVFSKTVFSIARSTFLILSAMVVIVIIIVIIIIIFRRDIVCLRNMSINTLHKGVGNDDDNNNNNKVLYF